MCLFYRLEPLFEDCTDRYFIKGLMRNRTRQLPSEHLIYVVPVQLFSLAWCFLNYAHLYLHTKTTNYK